MYPNLYQVENYPPGFLPAEYSNWEDYWRQIGWITGWGGWNGPISPIGPPEPQEPYDENKPPAPKEGEGMPSADARPATTTKPRWTSETTGGVAGYGWNPNIGRGNAVMPTGRLFRKAAITAAVPVAATVARGMAGGYGDTPPAAPETPTAPTTPSTEGAPGALTLAALMGQKQPSTWMKPGAGYGDIGFGGVPTGHVTYWNQAGRPYQAGQDLESYWYNIPEMKWYSGDLKGQITPQTKLPWMAQKYETPKGNNVQYFNEQGQPYLPGQPNSYWFNKADQAWYTGDLAGKIKQVGQLPWLG